MLGALIGGAAAIGSGIINAVNAKKNQKRQNQANLDMANLQFKHDNDMFDKGNAYNDPIQQMDRLKKAGLNPNMIYGTGVSGSTGQTSTSLPKYNAPQMSYNTPPPVDPTAILGSYNDFRIANAQVDNLKAQRDNTEQDTRNKTWLGGFNKDTEQFKKWSLEGAGKASKLKGDFMANDYSDNANGATPWQLAQRGLMDSQLSFNQGRVRAQTAGIEKTLAEKAMINQNIDYRQKQNEWYLTQMFTKMGIDALGGATKLISNFKGGKSFNQKAKPRTEPFNWPRMQH
jgi:hypothetical protein